MSELIRTATKSAGDFPLRRTREIKCHDLGVNDELLVMDLSADRAYFFNASMTTVWNLCDGTHSADQIAQSLAETFDDSEAVDLEQTVREALETLGGLDLLDVVGRQQERPASRPASRLLTENTSQKHSQLPRTILPDQPNRPT